MIDQSMIDVLKAKYQVFDIILNMTCDFADDIEMKLTRGGFERLIRDLFSTEKTVLDTRDVFSIVPVAIKNASDVVYVAKYAMDKYPLDVVATYGEKLRTAFEAEGHKLILIPQTIDVSAFTVEQLSEMRDGLTELINSLSYDNIMGF